MLALLKPLLGPVFAGFATLLAAVLVVWLFAGQLDNPVPAFGRTHHTAD